MYGDAIVVVILKTQPEYECVVIHTYAYGCSSFTMPLG